MTILETNTVDIVVIDDTASMIISDHLPWGNDDENHMYLLQEKINAYLRFYESGELVENFSDAKDKSVSIEIVAKYNLNQQASNFFSEVEKILNEAGIELIITIENFDMPKTPLHKSKFKKNLAVLAIIVGLCAILWAVTMIRIAGG